MLGMATPREICAVGIKENPKMIRIGICVLVCVFAGCSAHTQTTVLQPDRIDYSSDPSNPACTLVSITFQNPVVTDRFSGRLLETRRPEFSRATLCTVIAGKQAGTNTPLNLTHNIEKAESTCRFVVPSSNLENYVVCMEGGFDETFSVKQIKLKDPIGIGTPLA